MGGFAGAITWITFVASHEVSPFVERARCSIGPVAECKSSKGRKTSGGERIEDFAPPFDGAINQTKLSGSAAVELNPSKAFGGGNWRK